jgi:hypothetical protein
VRKRRNMEPRKLSKKEIKELQKEFPKIDKNIKARIQNKLEMIVLLFWIAMLVGVMYYLYLTLTYQV